MTIPSKLIVVHILRYGDESLGRYFFGVYSNLKNAINSVEEYNNFRGGKYPAFDYFEVELDKDGAFEYDNEKNLFTISLSKRV